ncbi:hypothetical protein COO91_02017 [Nostoc flagelliforme CCNUN1]|uniref:Uncharacterized protein n=1 Tax=Nostoc flagelliforme CCNUN1 TaxID=2038116 RepID=A0A2K8SKV9_9NOSO|nr:hypothetical protein COO91_02017 [Nostoc flagelliforme CCNUN1]
MDANYISELEQMEGSITGFTAPKKDDSKTQTKKVKPSKQKNK